ncbi:hypothetical protein ASE74_02515 [Pedobacter sp. Leaf216]|nr:hypothetical protein ASE74_02515 [Pedobacter sp. Leaf216]
MPMYTTKLTFLFALICLVGFAQKKKYEIIEPPSKEIGDVLEKRMVCIYRNIYAPEARLRFFPFNEYKKIVLISFELPEASTDIVIYDTDKPLVNAPDKKEVDLPLLTKKQKLDQTRIKEKKILSTFEIDKLTDILYNFGYKSTKSYKGLRIADEGYSCYNPRNAIVFLDEKGLIAEYIEICFECRRREESSEKIKSGEFCTEKYDLIRKYFYAAGIKYGTNKSKN